jgi:predicted permease
LGLALGVIVDTALPFFALILCGYVAVRAGVLDAASAKGLNTFVFWLALPALLLASVAASTLRELLDWRFLAVFYGVNGLLYAFTFLVGRAVWRDRAGTAALRALGVIWGNYGYLGLPLLTAALGPAAALPAVAVITCDILVPASITIAFLEAGRDGERSGLATLGRALAGPLRNPLILAVAAGGLLSATGVAPPAAAQAFLRLLGAAAGPCALVALGASLALSPAGGARGDVALVTVLKVVVNPALVWLAGRHLLPLEPDRLAAATLLAAMPVAASVFVLAQRYETWVLRASTSVLVTHLASVATLAALLYALGR